MNRHTGCTLTTRELIGQAITDILTTRIGTRVMRREYGSLIPELIDEPFNDVTRLRVYAAAVMALVRWEPRIRLNRIELLGTDLQGHAVLDLNGSIVDDHGPLSLSIPLHLGGSV